MPETPPVPYHRVRRTLERRWDCVVVGAGVGGLVAAAAVAQRGLSVLVLERHYRLGGFTQTFRRGGFEFDVGVHYVGDVLTGAAPVRRLFDSLTERRLRWSPLPEVYDRLALGEARLALGGGAENMRQAALEWAPHERDAIDRWFNELVACARAAPSFFATRPADCDRRRDRHPYFRWADVTTHEMARRLGCSARLEQMLTARHGNYGQPPETSSFAIHAASMEHYYRGAGYPVGGGSRIAAELAHTVEARGGALLVRAQVEAIEVRDGAVQGVRIQDGTTIETTRVVSDAGARATFGQLLADDAPGVGETWEALQEIGPSAAHVALYVGLESRPPAHGLDGANHWVAFDDPRFALGGVGAWIAGERDRPIGMFISVTSANDPTWIERRGERTALVASMLAPHAPFAAFEPSARGRRPPEYLALKARLRTQMLAMLEAHLPQVRGAVRHAELSTPLSTAHFTGHRAGEMYGLAHTPLRLRRGPSARTSIGGLVLAGQDAWLCGVGGAAFGGLTAASALVGRDLMRDHLL